MVFDPTTRGAACRPPRRSRRKGLVVTAAFWLLAGAADANAQEPVLVGFAQDTLRNDWREAQVREMAEVLERHPGIRFEYTDARGHTSRQAWDLEQLAARGAKVLVTSPRDGQVLAPVIARLHRSGVPVVLLTRQVEGEQYTSYVGADDFAIARSAAELIAERLEGKGRIVMLRGVPTTTTAIEREAGFLEVLADYPELQVVAWPTANYLRHEAIRETEALLRRGVEFDAIYAHSDSMAEGARIALRAAGVDPRELVIVGIDYIPEAREAIRRGEQTASFTYPTAGREGAEIVMRILAGQPVPKHREVPFTCVTRENVDQVPTTFERSHLADN